jgi:hypothetical protein
MRANLLRDWQSISQNFPLSTASPAKRQENPQMAMSCRDAGPRGVHAPAAGCIAVAASRNIENCEQEGHSSALAYNLIERMMRDSDRCECLVCGHCKALLVCLGSIGPSALCSRGRENFVRAKLVYYIVLIA